MFLYGRNITDHEFQGPPEDHLTMAPCLAEPHSTDKTYNFSLENKQQLNINIASFLLVTLASQTKKHGTTEVVQLRKQSITSLLIRIIGGLLKRYGKQ